MKTPKSNRSQRKENPKLGFLLPGTIALLLTIKIGTDIYSYITEDPIIRLMGTLNLSKQQLDAIEEVQKKYQPEIKKEKEELISSLNNLRESVEKDSILAVHKERLDLKNIKTQALFEIRDTLDSNQQKTLDKYLIKREEKLT